MELWRKWFGVARTALPRQMRAGTISSNVAPTVLSHLGRSFRGGSAPPPPRWGRICRAICAKCWRELCGRVAWRMCGINEMQMRVYINPRSGLSTYQQEVLAHRHLLNGHTCILEVAAALGPHESAPYIMWLVDTFVINVHEFTKVGDIQFLKLWNMDVHTAQLLHVRCGFDVNTHMTSNLVNTYAGSRLR